MVGESTKDVTEFGASNVKCELLGQAKKVINSSIGKTIALNDKGSRVVYLLCGHIHRHETFVHRGSYEDGSLATNPFQEKDLLRKDIMREAWDISVSKRLRSNNHLNALRGYVQVNDYLWREIVAVANF